MVFEVGPPISNAGPVGPHPANLSKDLTGHAYSLRGSETTTTFCPPRLLERDEAIPVTVHVFAHIATVHGDEHTTYHTVRMLGRPLWSASSDQNSSTRFLPVFFAR